jgi:hypothetical protein
MSGPSVGGGGRGDPFGNIFGSGGGDKQVYPPAPPGYKYVDLSIPQAPPGYSVAKMSSIANNQSIPAPAYGVQGGGAYGGNAGLYGRGTGARTSYQFNAHSAEGIRERLQAEQMAKQVRANQYAELQGLAPPYPVSGQQGAAPGMAANQYGGGQGYRPPPSAMISGTPWATVNPGAGNTTPFHMPGDPLAPPVAGPAGAPSVLNPMVPSGGSAKPAAPVDPNKGGIVTLSNGGQALQIPGMDHLIPLKMTASGPVPQFTHPKFSPEGAAERIAVQKFVGGLNLEATTNALNPPVAAPPPVAMPPPPRGAPPAANNAPPVGTNQPPAGAPAAAPEQSLIQRFIPDVLWKMGSGAYEALTGPPVLQSQGAGTGPSGIVAPNAPTAPNPSAPPVSAQQYDPINNGQEEDQ